MCWRDGISRIGACVIAECLEPSYSHTLNLFEGEIPLNLNYSASFHHPFRESMVKFNIRGQQSQTSSEVFMVWGRYIYIYLKLFSLHGLHTVLYFCQMPFSGMLHQHFASASISE